jgi:glycosyltransferase involved in cell wall biosynthesis
MRVGILGTRGIPNTYGGFEQFAQYLALGLVARGYEVFVYNSGDHPYAENQWNGVRIIHCKDWESKLGTAGQFVYDYNCFRDAARRNYDILLQLGYTSSSIWHRIWPRDAVNVVNMDGLEWKRSKYNRITRRFLRLAERWAATHANVLVADSIGIRDHIRHRYDKDAIFIPYGADIPQEYDETVPARLGLTADGYLLLVARMEPENNIETILQGWMASGKGRPLILIGNTGNRFGRYLTETYRHDKLRFIGPIYDLPALNALRHYAYLYFHGHSVGGTNPSLLEAMACGCPIAAHDNIFNKSVLGADAWYFTTPEDVASLMDSPSVSATRTAFREHNLEKIGQSYRWEKIVDDYEKLFILQRRK